MIEVKLTDEEKRMLQGEMGSVRLTAAGDDTHLVTVI